MPINPELGCGFGVWEASEVSSHSCHFGSWPKMHSQLFQVFQLKESVTRIGLDFGVSGGDLAN
jgi:hypothetical protein